MLKRNRRGTVEPFTGPIALLVLWGGAILLADIHCIELMDQGQLKGCSLVSEDSFRAAKWKDEVGGRMEG